MTGKQRIIADTIITVICKEFRVFKENMIVHHTAALILSETYFNLKETADLLSIKETEAAEKTVIANNAFWEHREYRRLIYRIISKVHQELSFSKPKQKIPFLKSTMPGIDIQIFNRGDILYQPRRRKQNE